LKNDVLSVLLQAENEYHNVVRDSVKDAESYVERRRKEQADDNDRLKRKLEFFEKTESELLEQKLLAESERMERKAERLKEKMRIRQEEKADQISELLKEEVLSLL